MGMYVLDLPEVGRNDLRTAGGKGANLGELVRAGFPVPPGFIVTTAAYELFVANNRLGEAITRATGGGLDGGSIRAAFEASPIPPEIVNEIISAYRGLGGGPVAVRSSATAEDLPGAAFAGQMDSFLDVEGEEALLSYVRRCWASLWTDRAMAYREQNSVDHAKASIAVVVQRMARAEFAGVMFTADPVTGARDRVVIDAHPGLGEAVVSGIATPDHHVLKKGRLGWRVYLSRPGRRGPGIEGTDLPGRVLRRLAGMGAAVERHFGAPQDVEWAWSGSEVSVVQARPMTALPGPEPNKGRLGRLRDAMFAELLGIRPYPADMTTWWPALWGAALSILGAIGYTVPRFAEFFDEDDGVAVRLRQKPAPKHTPLILLAPFKLPVLAMLYNPARWRDDPAFGKALSLTRELEARDLRTLSWDELISTEREAMSVVPLIGKIRLLYFPRAGLAAGVLVLMLKRLKRPDLFATFLSGTETETKRMELALQDLAAKYHGPGFEEGLRSFLDRYGHRETHITGPSQPTWKDAPEVVTGMVRAYALGGPYPRAGKPAWEAARDELLGHWIFSLPGTRRIFLRILRGARWFMQMREDTRFYATMPLTAMRRALVEMGERLVDVGALDSPEDVFHLKLEELEEAGRKWPPDARLVTELRGTVSRRRELRESLEGVPLLERRPHALGPEGDILLRGMPGSPGVAVGPVRIIRGASEFHKLGFGEVLVAPFTNPSWTPLFRRAAAVIADTGSAASHAAIVAREYGIPAVMSTVDGTSELTDGQMVRVDGDRGLVLAVRPAYDLPRSRTTASSMVSG